jgi:hypothetical protein
MPNDTLRCQARLEETLDEASGLHVAEAGVAILRRPLGLGHEMPFRGVPMATAPRLQSIQRKSELAIEGRSDAS